MKLKIPTIFAALILAGCGGGDAPRDTAAADGEAATTRPAETEARDTETAAARDAEPAAREPTPSQPRDAREERIELAQADAAPATGEFRSGQHYQTLSPVQPTSTGPEQVEVAEFFMYSCIHCYNFDPYLEEWKQSLPDYVNFVRVPTVWNPTVRLHAQAFYTAEALGKLDEMHGEFFREMHVNGNYLETEDALAEFFGRFDVSRDEFAKTFNSFAINVKVQRADELARRYRISSTPSIVINGKYTTNASMAGGYPKLLELIDTLAAAENTAD